MSILYFYKLTFGKLWWKELSRGGNFGGFSLFLLPNCVDCIKSWSLVAVTWCCPISPEDPDAPNPDDPELPPPLPAIVYGSSSDGIGILGRFFISIGRWTAKW